MISVNLTNQTISLDARAKLPDLSELSRVEIFERIVGLINARNSVADECIPNVLENASTVKPVRNPRESNNHPGISKGSSMRKKIYI